MASRGVASRGVRPTPGGPAAARRGSSPTPGDARRGRSGSPVPGRTDSPGPGGRGASPGRPSTTPARLVQPQDVKTVFNRFDRDGNGTIDRKELIAVLRELDPVQWTDRNATLLLMSVDKNNDGKVDYGEFVDWVSQEGDSQDRFRKEMDMPRTRAELAEFEKKRAAEAAKGTPVGLESEKKLAALRLDALTVAQAQLTKAKQLFDDQKAEAEEASKIFMPTWDKFKTCSKDVMVPAKELLEDNMKEVGTEVTIPDPKGGPTPILVVVPPVEVNLVTKGMCALFKVHPSQGANSEPDYWDAFLNAVLNPKLLQQMEGFDKEHIETHAASVIAQLCDDDRFDPKAVKESAKQMGPSADFIRAMCQWIHFLHKYRQADVKKLWEKVRLTEVQMRQDERDVENKDAALATVKRSIAQMERDMKK